MWRSLQIVVLLAALGALAVGQQNQRPAMTGPPINAANLTVPLSIPIGTPFVRQLTSRSGSPLTGWKVKFSKLPDGMELTPDGILFGEPAKAGTFAFRLTAEDGDGAVIFPMTIVVTADLISIDWKKAPRVQGESINGSVVFTSRLSRPADITVIIVAVNEVNKAFALGYQHFKFAPGTAPLVIPFGTQLPFGGYIIHADAIAEIPPKSIYRSRKETSSRLTITQQ
jgi:hypothetical protein